MEEALDKLFQSQQPNAAANFLQRFHKLKTLKRVFAISKQAFVRDVSPYFEGVDDVAALVEPLYALSYEAVAEAARTREMSGVDTQELGDVGPSAAVEGIASVESFEPTEAQIEEMDTGLATEATNEDISMIDSEAENAAMAATGGEGTGQPGSPLEANNQPMTENDNHPIAEADKPPMVETDIQIMSLADDHAMTEVDTQPMAETDELGSQQIHGHESQTTSYGSEPVFPTHEEAPQAQKESCDDLTAFTKSDATNAKRESVQSGEETNYESPSQGNVDAMEGTAFESQTVFAEPSAQCLNEGIDESVAKDENRSTEVLFAQNKNEAIQGPDAKAESINGEVTQIQSHHEPDGVAHSQNDVDSSDAPAKENEHDRNAPSEDDRDVSMAQIEDTKIEGSSSTDQENSQLMTVNVDLHDEGAKAEAEAATAESQDGQEASTETLCTANKTYNVWVGDLGPDVSEEEVKEAFLSFGEIKRVRVLRDRLTGKSKGFGFVHFATQEGMKAALLAVAQPPIVAGQPCRVGPSAERVTVQLGNLPQNITAESLLETLQETLGSAAISSVRMNMGEGGRPPTALLHLVDQLTALDTLRRLNTEPVKLEEKLVTASLVATEDDPELFQGKTLYLANLDIAITQEDVTAACQPFGPVNKVTLRQSTGGGGGRAYAFVELDSKANVDAAIAALHNTKMGGRVVQAYQAKPRGPRPLRMTPGSGKSFRGSPEHQRFYRRPSTPMRGDPNHHAEHLYAGPYPRAHYPPAYGRNYRERNVGGLPSSLGAYRAEARADYPGAGEPYGGGQGGEMVGSYGGEIRGPYGGGHGGKFHESYRSSYGGPTDSRYAENSRGYGGGVESGYAKTYKSGYGTAADNQYSESRRSSYGGAGGVRYAENYPKGYESTAESKYTENYRSSYGAAAEKAYPESHRSSYAVVGESKYPENYRNDYGTTTDSRNSDKYRSYGEGTETKYSESYRGGYGVAYESKGTGNVHSGYGGDSSAAQSWQYRSAYEQEYRENSGGARGVYGGETSSGYGHSRTASRPEDSAAYTTHSQSGEYYRSQGRYDESYSQSTKGYSDAYDKGVERSSSQKGRSHSSSRYQPYYRE